MTVLITIATALAPFFQIQSQRKPIVKKPVAASKPENLDLRGFEKTPVEHTMAAAFKSGSLPTAAPLPEGLPQMQAYELAVQIAARDANSTAALSTALKAAGYGIRDANGNIDFNQGEWQGFAIDHWEIAYLAKQYGDGARIGLDRFAKSLGEFFPEWKRDDNAQALVAAIRNASFSRSRSLQVWSNLIVELGRKSAVPYDLHNDVEAKHASLDIIQLYLIVTRLAGDLKVLADKAGPVSANQLNPDAKRMIGVLERTDFGTTTADDPAKPACTLTEGNLLFLDMNATGMNVAFGQFMGYLEDKKVISKTPGAIMGGLNAALIALKLIMTYATLDAEIKMDADMLTRTKTMADGEKRQLTAKVKLDIGNWQIANCIRPALNSAGLDFSLPADGSLANVRVDWMLASGGQSWGNRIDNMIGEKFDSDQLVYLDWQPFAKPDDKGKYYAYTDDQGIAKTYMVGYRQPKDLSGKSVKPVIKEVVVYLDIQVKTMKIKTGNDVAGTANDIAGSAIAFWTGDLPGSAAATLAETTYRSPYGFSKKQKLPIKDWSPCDGGWRGTISYRKVQFNNSIYEHRDGRMNSLKYFTAGREVDQYDGRIRVNPNDANPNLVEAIGLVSYRRSMFKYDRSDSITSCGNKAGSQRPVTNEGLANEQFTAAGSGEADFSLHIHSTGTGVLNFKLPYAEGEFSSSANNAVSGGCGPKPPHSVSDKRPYRMEGELYTVNDVEVDAENPNVLKGTRTIKGPHGRSIIVTWDLYRCNG